MWDQVTMAVPGKWFLAVLCAYGLVASLVFAFAPVVRQWRAVKYSYFVGYMALCALFASAQGQHLDVGPMDFGAAFTAMMKLLGGLFVGTLFNIVALYYCLVGALTAIGRWMWGLDSMTVRKTYDKAEAARERGDLEAAAEIYRQELEKEPQDAEARRRLAEILLEMDRTEEGVAELRALLKRLQGYRSYFGAAIRMGVVLEEELGDRAGAEQVYRAVLARYPRGEYAQYARARLGEPDQ